MKKKVLKLFAIMLVGSMFVLAVSGCGKKTSEKEAEKTVTKQETAKNKKDDKEDKKKGKNQSEQVREADYDHKTTEQEQKSDQSQTSKEQETDVDEPEKKETSDQIFVYIGDDSSGYSKYDANISGEMTPEKLIQSISNITGWNLSLAEEVATGKGGMTVMFSRDSAIVTGPPEEQKEEFWAYDVCSFSAMVLDSIKETLQQNYVSSPGDPNKLDIYFDLQDNEEIIIDGKIVPIDKPWDSSILHN